VAEDFAFSAIEMYTLTQVVEISAPLLGATPVESALA
jgi:hypothetical protein